MSCNIIGLILHHARALTYTYFLYTKCIYQHVHVQLAWDISLYCEQMHGGTCEGNMLGNYCWPILRCAVLS